MFWKIKKWFISAKSSQPSRAEIQAGIQSIEELESILAGGTRPAQILAGSAFSFGKQREHNEDGLFSLSSILVEGDREIPFGLFMVADGMGGHQYGEVASGTALRTVAEYLIARLAPSLMGMQSQQQEDSLLEMMNKAVQEAQKEVLNRAPGGGTTLTAALMIGSQITLAHIGDSRAYLFSSQGKAQVLTQDHSLVRRMVQLGQITEEEAEVHPQRHVLYRALGQNDQLIPEINNLSFPRGGCMMLCTDGLWGVVSDRRIAEILSTDKDLTEKCQALINAANAGGGPDNITVVLVQFRE